MPQPKQSYTRAHVSFQLTSSTDISTVNALNQNSLFSVEKTCRTGKHQRKWVIEMNDACQLYLKTYGRVDTMDSLVKNCKVYYHSWKHWHAAKNHGLFIGVVAAYNMYKEVMQEACGEWEIDSDMAKRKFLNFQEFRERLSDQGLWCDPKKRVYPGDAHMRVSTKQTKQERMASKSAKQMRGKDTEPTNGAANVVAPQAFKKVKDKEDDMKSRYRGLPHAHLHHWKF